MNQSSLGVFERADWEWTEAGRFLQARLTLSASMRPEAFLRLPKDWAFFWKSKEQTSWLAAWGLAEKIAFDELMRQPLPKTLTVCGGFPFAPAEAASEWRELADEHWFVPKFIWRQNADHAVLEVVCPLAAAANDDSSKSRLLAEAWNFYQALQEASAQESQDLPAYGPRDDEPSRERWQDLLQDAQRAMAAGRFGKVVLSRRVCLQFPEPLPAADLFARLVTLREESFLFACQSPSGLCFMGRSPERLLAWQGPRFQLDAIAGTRRRSASTSGDQASSEDMQQSPKEQNEHRLVGQAITDILEAEHIPFEPIEEQAIIRLQHVQHMRTRFQGLMPAARSAAELLPRLHPTPAVGGYPRLPALAFMRQEEGFDRGRFAGGIGVFQGSSGDVAIGIRSALLAGSKLWLYAGAGIVPGSDPEAEWQEIEAKMQNFLGFLQAEEPA